jgi:uncharacterized protein
MHEKKLTLKDVIAQYLRRNPSFLSEYPDILESLQLSHASGSASSLIEKQVVHLRNKNHELNRQLSRMVQVASENEHLMSRLHRLTLELMSLNDLALFFQQLGRSLLQDFKADILRICLFDARHAALASEEVRWVDRKDEGLQQFHAHLEKEHTVCGRLNDGKLNFLFGAKARWVQSTALIPLGENGTDGMMAIGSSDPGRFYPGMGTLFLDLLADVISSSLHNTHPEEERLSA